MYKYTNYLWTKYLRYLLAIKQNNIVYKIHTQMSGYKVQILIILIDNFTPVKDMQERAILQSHLVDNLLKYSNAGRIKEFSLLLQN